MEISKHSLVILATFFFLIYQIQAKGELKIEVLDFQANITNPELFSGSIYSSFNKQQVTVEFTMARSMSEWSATFNVDILPEGKPLKHILKLNTNICDCLRSTCRNNLVVALFKEIFRTSNFPKRCPLVANKKYYLRNYTMRIDDYPSYLPKVTWQVHLDMMFNRKSAMTWFIKGRTGKF